MPMNSKKTSVARSSPFTRVFTHLAENLYEAANDRDVDLFIANMPEVRRLIVMVLTDPRFQDELPKELRERLSVVLVT